MIGEIEWVGDEQELFWATLRPVFGEAWHLVVEPLPDGGWDWLAWSDQARRHACGGQAPTAEAAKQAAEKVAASIPLLLNEGLHLRRRLAT